jgi:AAA family ATP:ADP antiporter
MLPWRECLGYQFRHKNKDVCGEAVGEERAGGLTPRLAKLVAVRPGEGAALLWSFAYFFVLLAAYYILRPLRDQMGIAGGVRNLPYLFSVTFVVMLVAQPIYGTLVARVARAKFIPIVYQFFVANLAIFWALLHYDVSVRLVAQIFFVWISVFNLFAVAVFWSFMADLFGREQFKRLFGFIAAGGTAGSLVSPVVAIFLAKPLGPANLLLIAGVLLQVAVICILCLERAVAVMQPAHPSHDLFPEQQQNVGSGWLEGFTRIVKSPYLTGNAIWMVLLSFTGTVVYLEQANLVSASGMDPAAQIRIFATIDLSVGIITLLVQWLLTGRIMTKFGTAVALAFQPLIFVLGFAVLAVSPVLLVVLAFQSLQAAAGFAISNPARQVLFTVVSRDDKYKAKNVIDVVVFRASDAASSGIFAGLKSLGQSIEAVAATGLVLSLGWVALSCGLGRSEERRARHMQKLADARLIMAEASTAPSPQPWQESGALQAAPSLGDLLITPQ